MFSLEATIRDKSKDKTNILRKNGLIPAVLYGPEIKNINISVKRDNFLRIYKEAGESSLISLSLKDKVFQVLIHEVAFDPVSDELIHVDFYSPSEKERVEAKIPLVFVGKAPAVKSYGGILIKEIKEIPVKGFAKDLPKEIVVDISNLKKIEDKILIRDLNVPNKIEIVKDKNDIVASIIEPEEEEISEKEEAPSETNTPEGEEKADKAQGK
ncbi:50S ribosomal protein L25 [bacterium]|nr:50S ribosomal protein L25 [bacterium]